MATAVTAVSVRHLRPCMHVLFLPYHHDSTCRLSETDSASGGPLDFEDELRGLDFVPLSHGASDSKPDAAAEVVVEEADEHEELQDGELAHVDVRARGRQLQEAPPHRYSSGDPSGLGLMSTMQHMQGGPGTGGGGGGGGAVTGASYGGPSGMGMIQGASYGGGGGAQMGGMSVGAGSGAGGAPAGGDDGGTWAWVSKEQLAQLAQMQAASTAGGGGSGGGGGGGANKGLVVGLSVAGTLVGLVSLFAGGLLVRRRMKRGESALPLPMFSPRGDASGQNVASGGGSSSSGGGPAMQTRSVSRSGAAGGSGSQRYARLDEGGEGEHELNPLGAQPEGVASGSSSGGKRGGKVLPSGPLSSSSTSS